MINKALERPAEWHRQKFYTLKETEVKCYLVFQSTEDGEEHNCFFPFSKKGYAEAVKIVEKLNQSRDRILTCNEKLKYLVPYRLQRNMQFNDWLEWCKEWGVKL